MTMPLCSQIVRDGENHSLPHGWGWWHLECITTAARAQCALPSDMPLLEVWSQPETQNGVELALAIGFKDPSDGEVLILRPLDRLRVWREW
jgi:hypothetical protein